MIPLSVNSWSKRFAMRATMSSTQALGKKRWTWCKRHVADVLVTYVRLPGNIDGWQIAERCRESDPELPVIYATGYSPTAPRPVPGSRIVNKPFHPDEVVRIVRELGGQKGMPPN
jgi:DNA-binding NtrC family response regulator